MNINEKCLLSYLSNPKRLDFNLDILNKYNVSKNNIINNSNFNDKKIEKLINVS